MTSTAAIANPLSRLRERAGVRARRFDAALFHFDCARLAREPLIPTLLPQAEKG